jgi:amino acid transporter/mannitol/fructose-specific phosphotransferase system IIA component (Ntr-type)
MANEKKLEKSLTLFDVFAICTGAMFSSGFFLLPGLAAAQTGPSVILAYLIAGIFIIPAMLAKAELSTAMPKAGGTYFFMDRSMGPLAGTIGGIGTWVALILKSAFALIGMGAYLALVVELPIKPLAVALTVAFAALNIVGAKESSQLQRYLVVTLLGVLVYVVAAGLGGVFGVQSWTATVQEFDPFFTDGFGGLMATVGFVFVSYAGLTKVASVAEEVENPDRNIPLGMALSLLVATTVYCLGVFVMVSLLDPVELREDLTPVATVVSELPVLLPTSVVLVMVSVAAVAAFASTGNAGIMSASRYPLAMARDRLVPDLFAKVGRTGTPVWSIIATAGLMILAIVGLDIDAVVKLASAFQLLIFGLLNLAVIVMRESKIDFYRPGFRMPLYPWLPVAGIVIPLYLVAQMGTKPLVLSSVLVLAAAGWFSFYALPRVRRTGAVFHLFRRLGRKRHRGLDHELRKIVSERGPENRETYGELIEEARIVETGKATDFREAMESGAHTLAEEMDLAVEDLSRLLVDEVDHGLMPVANGVAILHHRFAALERDHLLILRLPQTVRVEFDEQTAQILNHGPVDTVIFLLSPEQSPGRHLRILATLAAQVEAAGFRASLEVDDSDAAWRRLLMPEEGGEAE